MLGPMKLMIAAEFGSTGAFEMSVFHKSSDGNGTKPFRLAFCPGVITLQAGGGGEFPPPLLEVTCKLRELDAALPGFGFVTRTAKFPVDVAVPVAVNCVEESNAVARVAPARETCAPLTKLLPVIVREKLPVEIEVGEMLLSTGTGFHRVTALSPEALESAALTAETVMVFVAGTVAGAVYRPDELIVPVAALPPITPLTSHKACALDVLATVAENDCVAPARTFALGGVTLTVTAGGGVPVPPPPPGLLEMPSVPAQLACRIAEHRIRKGRTRRKWPPQSNHYGAS